MSGRCRGQKDTAKNTRHTSSKIPFWAIKAARLCLYSLPLLFAVSALVSCSLSEEMKRIEASKQYEEREDASRSTNLTGEQIFIRSCNSCHPGGKQGMGPSLIDMSKKYPDDDVLKAFIRKGKGIMPAQPANVINDIELTRLVAYIKALKE